MVGGLPGLGLNREESKEEVKEQVLKAIEELKGNRSIHKEGFSVLKELQGDDAFEQFWASF